MIDPVLTDIYAVFLNQQDWLIKEIHEPYLLTSIVGGDYPADYQFEAIPDEIFRKDYEMTHENVAANTSLTVLSQPKVLQRSRRRWDNPLIPNFQPSMIES